MISSLIAFVSGILVGFCVVVAWFDKEYSKIKREVNRQKDELYDLRNRINACLNDAYAVMKEINDASQEI